MGTKKGKVYFEYEEEGEINREDLQGFELVDGQPVNGDSEIVFVVPAMSAKVYDVVKLDPYRPFQKDRRRWDFTVNRLQIEKFIGGSGFGVEIRLLFP